MSKRLFPLLILAVGVLGFLVLKMTRPEPAEVSATERSWRVNVQTIEPGTHTPLLPLYGQVVAPEQLTVTATLAGRIGTRPVSEGERVKAGDLLVALDDADIGPVVSQAEAQVADLQAQLQAEAVRYRNDQSAIRSELAIRDNARRQLERTESLVKRNLASQENLEAVTDALARAELTVKTRQRAIEEHPARLQSLEAKLAQAEANLAIIRRDAERSRLAAPFDGVVTDVQVAPGDQVARNAPLLSLYPDRGLELRAQVPAVFRAELLEALDRGETLIASSEDGAHRFQLSRFAGTADPAGTEAILSLLGPGAGLRPGELLPVRLERPERDQTVAIPFSALYGADAVYLMNRDNRMERAVVQRIGEARAENGERWLLVAGDALEPGARLITTHLPNAVTGLKVELAESREESSP
ncbi:HlyD family efflux transporter periplasmic adaptor subunit [Marinobacter sp. M216]|uniref:HlyD family efflux transporter periplasmic adaptor subunit n=1 Tax=Marinobacter albus TaxID=3030833 RepID=A0ABT7HFG8_9GAMM|nr:HlyD family efflux transporter periplasmic adaptor subunit [Marinobacter sp. M216]MDK9558637.1 HlyD family efflux transporter periplasmic adaptor subunit [Marinobacter sp. M216]